MFKTTRVNYDDLENRTLEFAARVRKFVKAIPYNLANIEDSKQVIRSSGSVGANYIEANESLGKKDFIRICRQMLFRPEFS